jgi:hypothetical protein
MTGQIQHTGGASKQKVESFDYDILRQKQEKITGETGVISVALTSGIASRKMKEPSLFDGLKDTEIQTLKSVDSQHLVDRSGKPIYLTRYQNKIVFALSLFMSQHREEDEIQRYVAKLNAGIMPKSKIDLPISITEFTKVVELDGKARARQKEKVIGELKALSEIRQVQTFEANGRKLRFSAPLIQIAEQLEDLSPDKELNADFVRVTFGSIFFSELYTKYAVIKPQLFRIWGRAGSGTDTELFNVLLSDLLAKYSFHRIAAIKAAEAIKRGKYKTDASYYAAVNKAKRNALTYSEYAHTLRDRVTTDYESLRSYRARFKEHLNAAIDALINEIGIITEATQVQADGGIRIDFVFNFDYDKGRKGSPIYFLQERLPDRAALPPFGESSEEPTE